MSDLICDKCNQPILNESELVQKKTFNFHKVCPSNPMNEFDILADNMLERKYQLRVEHNHSDMKWYAYYAQRGQRNLFESDLYGSGDTDWKTASDTPTEALRKLQSQLSKIEEEGADDN